MSAKLFFDFAFRFFHVAVSFSSGNGNRTRCHYIARISPIVKILQTVAADKVHDIAVFLFENGQQQACIIVLSALSFGVVDNDFGSAVAKCGAAKFRAFVKVEISRAFVRRKICRNNHYAAYTEFGNRRAHHIDVFVVRRVERPSENQCLHTEIIPFHRKISTPETK